MTEAAGVRRQARGRVDGQAGEKVQGVLQQLKYTAALNPPARGAPAGAPANSAGDLHAARGTGTGALAMVPVRSSSKVVPSRGRPHFLAEQLRQMTEGHVQAEAGA